MDHKDFLKEKFGQIVLASSSPRRAQILQQVGFDFVVHPSHVEEELLHDDPMQAAKTIAMHKAAAVADRFPDQIVLAADTMVVLDGLILGKPAHADEARQMLSMLSGKTHEVHTAFALVHRRRAQEYAGVETTRVAFRALSSDDIDRYVSTGSVYDKAGAYGIQDASAIFVERIEGDFYNVVGLPIVSIYQIMMSQFNHKK